MLWYKSRWTWLITANLLAWCLFGLYPLTQAQQPKGPQLPFANSNEQRSDLVKEVREIKDLLKETNALLREGVERNATAKTQR